MSTFCSIWSGFYPYEMLKFVTAFCFVWNCSESPFLEVCKLTDLTAVKVGRFTDLVAVLVEYYWAKSNKGFNMQGLTHVLGKSKLFIRTYKVGAFTDLVAVFESHCWICTCREHAENLLKPCNLSYRLIGFVLQLQLDGTNEFSHGYDSRLIRLKILMIRHHKNFETTASFIYFMLFFFGGYVVQNVPMILFISP